MFSRKIRFDCHFVWLSRLGCYWDGVEVHLKHGAGHALFMRKTNLHCTDPSYLLSELWNDSKIVFVCFSATRRMYRSICWSSTFDCSWSSPKFGFCSEIAFIRLLLYPFEETLKLLVVTLVNPACAVAEDDGSSDASCLQSSCCSPKPRIFLRAAVPIKPISEVALLKTFAQMDT